MSEAVVLPKGNRGFYVCKEPCGQLCFGWPKSGVIWWEKVELSDLLNMGVEQNDIELLVPGQVYTAVVAPVRLHAWD